MKVLLLTSISIRVWWSIITVLAWVCPSKTLGYNTVTFNIQGASVRSYSTFVQSLRNEFGPGEHVEGIPVTRKETTIADRYLLVELKTTQRSVTLAMDVTDLYVVGYLDRNQGKNRANFLRDAPKVAKDNLFKGATVREIGFGGSYLDLERASKAYRETTSLGFPPLEKLLNSVSGENSVQTKTEAQFFIVSIQMVAEAARFKYIQNEIARNGIGKEFKPDNKVIVLENNWGKISKAIHGATKRKIDPELILTSGWRVNKVEDIKPYMGLTKFKS